MADQVVLRLTLLDDHADPGRPGIQVVLYAATPGAFVDMAADLAFLTGIALDGADLDQHQSLAGEPDITGVIQDQSVIDEAIGVLIAGGRTGDQACAELVPSPTQHTPTGPPKRPEYWSPSPRVARKRRTIDVSLRSVTRAPDRWVVVGVVTDLGRSAWVEQG